MRSLEITEEMAQQDLDRILHGHEVNQQTITNAANTILADCRFLIDGLDDPEFLSEYVGLSRGPQGYGTIPQSACDIVYRYVNKQVSQHTAAHLLREAIAQYAAIFSRQGIQVFHAADPPAARAAHI